MADFDGDWLAQVPEPGAELAGDAEYRAGLRRLREREQDALVPAWYWTRRLSQAANGIAAQLADLRFGPRLAAGFLPELDGAFGVVAYSETPERRRGGALGTSGIDRDAEPERPRAIQLDELRLPVVVRPSITEQHWCSAPEVLQPARARATCWVSSSSRGYQGWLLPRHALRPLRAPVGFDDGGRGRLLDHFGECIDAVVVSSDKPPPAGPPTRACWPMVAGQPLLISDRPNHHRQATILDVDLNLGVLASTLFPIRFSTDWVGRAGQSGSLIADPVSGEPAGLYLGRLRPSLPGYLPPGAAGITTGYAQTCFQLEAVAGMEFLL